MSNPVVKPEVRDITGSKHPFGVAVSDTPEIIMRFGPYGGGQEKDETPVYGKGGERMMQIGIAGVPGHERRNFRSPYGLPAIPAKEGWKPVTGLKENRRRKSYLPDPNQSPTGKNNCRSPAIIIDAGHLRKSVQQTTGSQ